MDYITKALIIYLAYNVIVFCVFGIYVSAWCRDHMIEFEKDIQEMDRQHRAFMLFLAKPEPGLTVCGCMGKQPNQPDCPCAMRFIVEVDGYYYRLRKLVDVWQAENIGLVSLFSNGQDKQCIPGVLLGS